MKDKKKILLISNMYPSVNNKHYGVFVKNTEEVLRNNGFIVDKVIMFKTNNKFIKLFKYIIFHLKVIFKGLFYNYDYLYVHFISHSSLGAVIVKKIKKNVKLILNCHGNDVIKDIEEEYKNVYRSHKYIKYGDKIIVPSNYFKKEVIKEYNISENKIFVYPSGGIDTNKFVKKDQLECKKKLGLSSNNNYIGYISRIEKNKGWDIFLKTIKELENNKQIANKRFLIVGNGVEYPKMISMINELKISAYIDLKNLVYQDELVDIYNALDIFVLPSYRKESLGLVGLEAMSCSVFTITSDNYGMTDYMENNINGFTFKLKDYKDLTNKINKVFELSSKEKELIINSGRKTALKYDIETIKNELLEVFR